MNVVWLHLGQVELLWAKDRSRSCDSDPADKAFSRDLEMLHGPQSNQGTSSAEACFAVDGDSPVIWSLEMPLNNIEEVSDDLVWRSRTVNEEEIVMLDTPVLEVHLVILLLVQSDDPGDIDILEDVDIFIWVVSISLALVSVLNWTHEGDELAWDDPVEVSVLDSLIVFVLLDIECPEIVPAEPDGVLETLKAMEKCAVVEAVSLGGISVVFEQVVVWLELLVSLLSRHLEDDDHEGSHQESTIDHLVTWVARTAVVEYPVLRVVLVSQETGQLSGVSVDHGQVEGAEVAVEWEVGEVVVDIEEEGVLEVLWGLCITHPVQLI